MIEKYFIYFLTCSNLPWTSSFTRGESARTKTYSPIKYFIACYKNDFKPLSWFGRHSLFWHRDKNTAWLTFSVKCVFFSIKRIYMGVTKNGSWIKDNIIELMKLVFIKRSYAWYIKTKYTSSRRLISHTILRNSSFESIVLTSVGLRPLPQTTNVEWSNVVEVMR